MKFGVSAKIDYEAGSSATIILNVQPYNFEGQRVISEKLIINPELKSRQLLSKKVEKRVKIIEITEEGPVSVHYKAAVENEMKMVPAEKLDDVPINRMSLAALSYLNASRYCQSDRLFKFADNKFGKIESSFEKCLAICDYIHQNVEYSAGFTTAQTSAFDTITEQVGVCRDFAHLGIALCRALTIPARYLTCYAYKLEPQDFHACFEAYLGGHWIIFDATKLAPLNGLIKIATGPDAADTAFAAAFGNISFQNVEVNVNLLSEDFTGVDYSTHSHGYSFA